MDLDILDELINSLDDSDNICLHKLNHNDNKLQYYGIPNESLELYTIIDHINEEILELTFEDITDLYTIEPEEVDLMEGYDFLLDLHSKSNNELYKTELEIILDQISNNF